MSTLFEHRAKKDNSKMFCISFSHELHPWNLEKKNLWSSVCKCENVREIFVYLCDFVSVMIFVTLCCLLLTPGSTLAQSVEVRHRRRVFQDWFDHCVHTAGYLSFVYLLLKGSGYHLHSLSRYLSPLLFHACTLQLLPGESVGAWCYWLQIICAYARVGWHYLDTSTLNKVHCIQNFCYFQLQ